ncbi:MAG: hypothetical protein PHO63_00635 [Bacilli bacterium]|nr:hypothetical protein [Bacilli bacterium]MDD4809459.1 hypothetical protein [Bacilli bacterium]
MNNHRLANYKLIIVILKKGLASNLIKKLKKYGLVGSTIMFGKGTAEKKFMNKSLVLSMNQKKKLF